MDRVIKAGVAREAPDYFPDLSYAALMVSVDEFTLTPEAQYSRQSLNNRTRLRTPDGSQWITVPIVSGQFGRSISDTRIDYRQNWITRHLKAFRYNYGTTPYYDHFIPGIETLLSARHEYLGQLTCGSVELIHCFLRARVSLHVSSTPQEQVRETGDELQRVRLHSRLSASDRLDPEAESIRVNVAPYRQNFEGFVPYMSVLDMLFNHGLSSAEMLKRAVTTLP